MGAAPAGARVRLALDNHYPPVNAVKLRDDGYDVVAAIERSWHREEDEELLSLCARETRALMTNNVGDFMTIARSWLTTGRTHAGLIFTADSSLPRTKQAVGRYLGALTELLDANPKDDAFEDRIHWL
jgi:hypothetical protein